jgi:hypothetical protein
MTPAAGRVQQKVREMAARLAAIDARVRDATQGLTALSMSKNVRFGRTVELPDLAKILPFSTKNLQTIAKDLEAGMKTQNDTFSALQDDIAALVKTHGDIGQQ